MDNTIVEEDILCPYKLSEIYERPIEIKKGDIVVAAQYPETPDIGITQISIATSDGRDLDEGGLHYDSVVLVYSEGGWSYPKEIGTVENPSVFNSFITIGDKICYVFVPTDKELRYIGKCLQVDETTLKAVGNQTVLKFVDEIKHKIEILGGNE